MNDIWFKPANKTPEPSGQAISDALLRVGDPIFIVDVEGAARICQSGTLVAASDAGPDPGLYKLLAMTMPLRPEKLGSAAFKKRHGIRYACVAGAMANGISSVKLVTAAGRAQMIGFFGSAGLSRNELEKALIQFKAEASKISWGVNLIHAPGSVDREAMMVDLYHKYGVRCISAAGYLRLTWPLVLYRLRGIHRAADGSVVCPNRVIGKVSRVEVARQFLSPAPAKIVAQLLETGKINETEAELSRFLPMADDITAEADSGGHTDNRPAITLLPSMMALRDECREKFAYTDLPCIGLAGGMGTPFAVAAAFAMGADYVLTGSINQACVEAGTSDVVKKLLSEATQTDITMAPAADMFERGVKVQVLKHKTLFALRATRLFELYHRYDDLEQIPSEARAELETKILQESLNDAWVQTRAFFTEYDPAQIARAETDPKHKMALVFRSYLGRSSRWAIAGDLQRAKDFQIWCGPAMGAFNEWAAGSFLADPANRAFESVSMNLLFGACVAIRRANLTHAGITIPDDAGRYAPLPVETIRTLMAGTD
jgi:trans-AT polyketide synthase, acyltransferase and oxidoreductase domains